MTKTLNISYYRRVAISFLFVFLLSSTKASNAFSATGTKQYPSAAKLSNSKKNHSRHHQPQKLWFHNSNKLTGKDISSTAATTTSLRGGATATTMIVETLSKSLQGGPYGVLSLWSIASAVLIPLTLYRQGYAFSVGYGYSVMTMGIALLLSFYDKSSIVSALNSALKNGAVPDASLLLTLSVVFYGFRLATFLLWRNLTTYKGKQMKSFDKSPPLKRLPFAISVGLFYAFMTTPAMYALRSNTNAIVSYVGAAVAWIGALLEGIADSHKSIVKQSTSNEDDGGTEFLGPAAGVFKICRHPNYLGEIVFWLGLLIGGVPSFGKSVIGWACSIFGFYGIFGIMTKATQRLDKQQYDKYKDQNKYKEYIKSVSSPLIPFVSNYPAAIEEEK